MAKANEGPQIQPTKYGPREFAAYCDSNGTPTGEIFHVKSCTLDRDSLSETPVNERVIGQSSVNCGYNGDLYAQEKTGDPNFPIRLVFKKIMTGVPERQLKELPSRRESKTSLDTSV
jgi:hypothetical protein